MPSSRYAGDRMLRTLGELYDHADRYVWLYIKGVPRALSIASEEHKRIAERCIVGDPAGAAAELARHLARTALTVLTHHAPEHDPVPVRAAIQAGDRRRHGARRGPGPRPDRSPGTPSATEGAGGTVPPAAPNNSQSVDT